MAPVRNTIGNFVQRILASPLPFPSLISILVAQIPIVVITLSMWNLSRDYISSRFITFPEETDAFDFIVVGGGSSGAAVAARLSAHYHVLLLEAGGDPHLLSSIPTVALVTLNVPLIDWAYKTVPQENACLALKNNVSQWPRGKALGGSSVQNIMMYMRGNPNDYNTWANITGNNEWSYESLLPYFMKLEDYNGHHLNNGFHGKGGPVYIEGLRFAPGLENWLAAGEELGYKLQDPNSYQTEGFSPMDVTMKKGSRFSTYKAYIKPSLGRRNLSVYRYAQVVKIHLDLQRRAYGVTYFRHGRFNFVRANKEIIVSAGALDSPRLLMLSGIGSKEHLHSVGLKCRINLPGVGKNLQDHIFTTVGPIILDKPVSFNLDRDTNLNTVIDYFWRGSGPMVSIAGINGAALISTSQVPESEKNWPDIFLFGIGIGVHTSFGLESDQAFGFKPGTLESFYSPSVGKDANFVSVNLGRPKSVGDITLKNSNPFDSPSIDPKYFSHDDDVKAMVEGAKFAVHLYENSTTYRKLNARLAPNKFPGCEHFELKSDAYWECYVKHFTLTVYHPCCTCKMGKGLEDKLAVVDSELRVLKTTGLRVIDASIMPTITNANLNCLSIMIGEKGADLVLKYWATQSEVSNKMDYLLNSHEDKCFYNTN